MNSILHRIRYSANWSGSREENSLVIVRLCDHIDSLEKRLAKLEEPVSDTTKSDKYKVNLTPGDDETYLIVSVDLGSDVTTTVYREEVDELVAVLQDAKDFLKSQENKNA